MVTIIGRASVGKSTLMNRILGEKVAIVSPVPQTTRNLVRGILTEPRGQIAFVDTPGIHKASRPLGLIMNRLARSAAQGADVTVLVLDASSPPRDEDGGWMRRVAGGTEAFVFILNKTDLGDAFVSAYEELWATTQKEKQSDREATWIRTSASSGLGVPALLDFLFGILPEGPALFPEDIISDYPRKLQIADLIREKLFAELHHELPHDVAVAVTDIKEKEDRWIVEANIYVQRGAQKRIVIGEKGRLIRKVERSATRELSEIYERQIDLELWVKVQPNWDKNFWIMRELGHS